MTVPKMHWVDLAVIVIYFASMLGMGLYFMRRQKNTSEFLLASRNVAWFAIGLSLLSSLNSAMDYVVGPASYMEWGLLLGVGLISILIAFPIIFKIFIPFYQGLPVYNCYEYLEHRFDVRVRTVASVIFLLWRICWMSFTIYLPAYVLHIVLGFDSFWTVLALGAITTIYTTIGGVRAVIWTDVIQALIMFTGIILAIGILVNAIPGGFAAVWQTASDADLIYVKARIPGWEEARGFWEKTGLYFHQPLTFFAILISTFLGQLNIYGADQVMIQRYLSARSLSDCKKGFITNACAYIFYTILFMILSMALLAYFKHNPLDEQMRYEYYFPYFIGFKMPIVIKGLILAAIYSAAQSSVSAGISASTSVIYSNFYLRLLHGQVTPEESNIEEIRRNHLFFTRGCALCFGATVTTLACFIGDLGPLFPLANRIVASFSGIMIAVFLLGMFTKRARSLGVAIGACCALAGIFTWGFGHTWGLFENALGYGWTGIIGFCTTIGVGYFVSFFEKEPPKEKMQWLWKEVMARK